MTDANLGGDDYDGAALLERLRLAGREYRRGIVYSDVASLNAYCAGLGRGIVLAARRWDPSRDAERVARYCVDGRASELDGLLGLWDEVMRLRGALAPLSSDEPDVAALTPTDPYVPTLADRAKGAGLASLPALGTSPGIYAFETAELFGEATREEFLRVARLEPRGPLADARARWDDVLSALHPVRSLDLSMEPRPVGEAIRPHPIRVLWEVAETPGRARLTAKRAEALAPALGARERAWLRRRVRALDERVGVIAAHVSARHALLEECASSLGRLEEIGRAVTAALCEYADAAAVDAERSRIKHMLEGTFLGDFCTPSNLWDEPDLPERVEALCDSWPTVVSQTPAVVAYSADTWRGARGDEPSVPDAVLELLDRCHRTPAFARVAALADAHHVRSWLTAIDTFVEHADNEVGGGPPVDRDTLVAFWGAGLALRDFLDGISLARAIASEQESADHG